MYTVKQYTSTYYKAWNKFVSESKNGTFLFHRDFMEYHADRFTDFSLLVFEGDNLVALLPANRVGDAVHSHQGLTYGGLVFKGSIGLEKTEGIFEAVCGYFNLAGIRVLHIRQCPLFYCKEACYEIDYLMFKNNARIYRRDMNMAIPLQQGYRISNSKLKYYGRAKATGMVIIQDNDFDAFWDNVLLPRLADKHGSKPVHTKGEINLLHSRFPENILQYNVFYEDEIIAGVTLFKFDTVIKSQYSATTPAGEKLRALDYLFISLTEQYKEQMLYFDRGTVTENQGKDYKKGLVKQKEELGCKVFLQDFYEVETVNFIHLSNVL